MATFEIMHQGNTYHLSEQSLTRTSPTVEIDSIEAFVWDVLLAEIFDEVVETIGQGVGKEVLKRLFGTRSGWEEETALKLQIIIGKLDEILAAVKDLKNYIDDSTREELKAEASAYMKLTSRIITNSKKHKKLEAKDNEILTQISPEFEASILKILTAEQPRTGNPMGVPLYALVQAGVLQVWASYKILGGTLHETVSDEPIATFTRWQQYLNEYIATSVTNAYAEAKALDSYLKSAPMSWCTDADGTYKIRSAAHNGFIITVSIRGGLNEEFSIAGIDMAPPIDRANPNEWKNKVHNVQQWPIPYHFSSPLGKHSHQDNVVRYRVYRMIDWLNGRRNTLLLELERLNGIKALIDSLETGKARLGRLR